MSKYEDGLVSDIVKELKKEFGGNIIIIDTQDIGDGCHDLLLCVMGCFGTLEVKKGHRLTGNQDVFAKQVYSAGGSPGVAYSVEDALKFVNDLIDNRVNNITNQGE